MRLNADACEHDVGSAYDNLAMAYLNGSGVTQDAARAIELGKKACDLDDAHGCENLERLGVTPPSVGPGEKTEDGTYRER